MLIGNKNDLVYLREVGMGDVEKVKSDMKIAMYFQTSALLNINVNEAFTTYLNQVAKQATFGIKKPLKLRKKENINRCYY